MGVQAPELAGCLGPPLSPGEGAAPVRVARECSGADLPRAPSLCGVCVLWGAVARCLGSRAWHAWRPVSAQLRGGLKAPPTLSSSHRPLHPRTTPRALTRLPRSGRRGGGGHVSGRGSGRGMERPFPPRPGPKPLPVRRQAQGAQTVTSVVCSRVEGAGRWAPGRRAPRKGLPASGPVQLHAVVPTRSVRVAAGCACPSRPCSPAPAELPRPAPSFKTHTADKRGGLVGARPACPPRRLPPSRWDPASPPLTLPGPPAPCERGAERVSVGTLACHLSVPFPW